MVIFNIIGLAQILIAMLPGVAVAGVAHLLGGDFDFWLFLTAFTLVIPVDALWRVAGIADSEGDDGEVEPGGGILNVVLPGGGGHLFFIPNWIVGGLVSGAICTGYLT